MKKILLLMTAFIVGSIGTSAQKVTSKAKKIEVTKTVKTYGKRMGIGINLGAAPCIEKHASVTNLIVGAKYQYQVTNLIRLQADVDFGFKDKGISTFNAMANAHFMIPCANRFYLYPLAGIGYGSVKSSFRIDGHEVSNTADKLAFNVGIGAEYEVTSNFAANFEFKYQYMQDFSRVPVLIGIIYKF